MNATKRKDGQYVVTRTSLGREWTEVSPCDGATLGWRAVIKNGATVGYMRVWLVEVPCLREFIAKHGPCVVQVDAADGRDTIEIYDDYREAP